MRTTTQYSQYITGRNLRRRSPLARIRDNAPFILAGLVIALLGGGVLGYEGAQHLLPGSATCTVTAKNFSQSSDGHGSSHGVYRIATSDCGVLEVRDNPLKLKFNSADTYYQIQTGQRYHFEYTGFRFPLLSGFPGILTATPVQG